MTEEDRQYEKIIKALQTDEDPPRDLTNIRKDDMDQLPRVRHR